MSNAEPGADFPREVTLEEGMPKGWKGIEKVYGPTSKYAGKVYCRFYSLDGKHKHVSSPKQVIIIHCGALGLDPEPMLEEYTRLQKERQQGIQEEKRLEKEVKGQVKGGQREAAVARFRERFGPLSGPVVFQFQGWVTRWHYQPGCEQVMVEYLDPEGNSWKLLKDLECSFQFRIENGGSKEISELIERAQVLADPKHFAEGAKRARETRATYEVSPEVGERVLDPAEREKTRREREEARKASEQPSKRVRQITPGSSSSEPLDQEGWAAAESKAEVQEAFGRFRDLLQRRGFKTDVELLAVVGTAREWKYAKRARGIYLQMPELFQDQISYQKLLHCPKAREELGCDGIFMVWSSAQSRWELTTQLQQTRPVLAHSAESPAGSVFQAKGPWLVQDGSANSYQDSDIRVLAEAKVETGSSAK